MAKKDSKNLLPLKKKQIKKNNKLDPGFERFMNVTDTKDLVAMVLKSHLLTEYYIDQLIIIHVPRGDIITNGRLNFYNKLIVIRGLKLLLDEDIEAIEGLNALRNDCSHVLNYEIGEKDVDKIGKSYGVEYLEQKEEMSSNIHRLLHFSLMRIVAHLDAQKKYCLIHCKNKTRPGKDKKSLHY